MPLRKTEWLHMRFTQVALFSLVQTAHTSQEIRKSSLPGWMGVENAPYIYAFEKSAVVQASAYDPSLSGAISLMARPVI